MKGNLSPKGLLSNFSKRLLCSRYFEKTGRRISFEYAMIDGVNDSDECARELSRRIHGMLAHVNLIPVNSVSGSDYRKSRSDRLKSFIDILAASGITATVRRTLGSDINASCGQLRSSVAEKKTAKGESTQ